MGRLKQASWLLGSLGRSGLVRRVLIELDDSGAELCITHSTAAHGRSRLDVSIRGLSSGM